MADENHESNNSSTNNFMKIDFSLNARTGAFRGGASGILYGLGDEGVPPRALINGAHITSVSQKAPFGTQHPSGDALKTEASFFARHGRDMCIYIQDYYPDWPYNAGQRPGDTRQYNLKDGTFTEGANGVWDYLEIVEFVTEAVASRSMRPEQYVFIPFNEPDGGNWYADWATMQQQFLKDWKDAYERIQAVWSRHGLGHARVGGPGHTRWRADQSADLLRFARDNACLPDIFIWHELGIENLRTYRSHYNEYRQLEASLNISPIFVNITEYGMLRDMGVPGQLIQWFSLFESTKVDAQAAYWNYAGNLSDNSARAGGANGGWWMFKWYGDLEGSETATLVSPSPDTVDTLQGIAAIDTTDRRATVLWGGGGGEVNLTLAGLDPSLFGGGVDIEIREDRLCGAEGMAETPQIIMALRNVSTGSGELQIRVPHCDRYAGYQLLVTPLQTRDVTASLRQQPWYLTAEVEDLDITGAQIYVQDPQASGGWQFMASGGRDVGHFSSVDSRVDWVISVPQPGAYRLQVTGATPGKPGRHALFVDGKADGVVQYTADLALTDTHRWKYRGSAERTIVLTAGNHTLSLRSSADGQTLLPGSDITLDRLALKFTGEGEPTEYPATTFRLSNGAMLSWDEPGAGMALLSGHAQAALYVTAMETGYYDIRVDWLASGSDSVFNLTLRDRTFTVPAATGTGRWSSTLCLHLAEGINEIMIGNASEGTRIGRLLTRRNNQADRHIVWVEAEAACLTGAVSMVGPATEASNAYGGRYITGLGGGQANAVETGRDGLSVSGEYDITFYYSNAALGGHHDYNPQVLDLSLSIAEGEAVTVTGNFRYTYAWDSFWARTLPLTLKTASDPLRIYSDSEQGPAIDRIAIAPVQAGNPETHPAS